MLDEIGGAAAQLISRWPHRRAPSTAERRVRPGSVRPGDRVSAPRQVRPAIVGSLAWRSESVVRRGAGRPRHGTCLTGHGCPRCRIAPSLHGPQCSTRSSPSRRGRPPIIATHPIPIRLGRRMVPRRVGHPVDRRSSIAAAASQRGTSALHDQLGSTDGVPGGLASLHHLAAPVLLHGRNAPFRRAGRPHGRVGLQGWPTRPGGRHRGARDRRGYLLLGPVRTPASRTPARPSTPSRAADRPDGPGRGWRDRPPRRVTNIAQDRHQLSTRWALRPLRRPDLLTSM